MRSDILDILIPVIIALAILVAGITIGYEAGSKVDTCRQVIINDVAKSHKFEDELMAAMNPDFLTVMGGKK